MLLENAFQSIAVAIAGGYYEDARRLANVMYELEVTDMTDAEKAEYISEANSIIDKHELA
jgi:hypothetical protein